MKIKQFISKHKIISVIIGVVIFLVLAFALVGPIPLSGYFLEFDYLNPYYVALEPVCDDDRTFFSIFPFACFFLGDFRVTVNSYMTDEEVKTFGEENGWHVSLSINSVGRSEKEQTTSFLVTIPDIITKREHKKAKRMLKKHTQIIEVENVPQLDFFHRV